MQEPRRPGDTSDDGTVSNTNKPEVKSSRVNFLASPLFAAGLTAVTSIVLFSFNQVKVVDARLDELEKEVRIVLTPNGLAASQEALEAYYGLLALKERFSYLENKLHFHEN